MLPDPLSHANRIGLPKSQLCLMAMAEEADVALEEAVAQVVARMVELTRKPLYPHPQRRSGVGGVASAHHAGKSGHSRWLGILQGGINRAVTKITRFRL